MSVKEEETEEAETRAMHAKMQLEDMARQVAAQEAKTEMLERMLAQQQTESKKLRRRSSLEQQQTPRRVSLRTVPGDHQEDGPRNWKRTSRTGNSDSGFESDGDSDSVFSLRSPASSSASTTESDGGARTTDVGGRGSDGGARVSVGTVSDVGSPAEAEKVRIVRVERGHDAVFHSNVARAYAPIEMRIENQRLRERVVELELAVEGCLDLVTGSVR